MNFKEYRKKIEQVPYTRGLEYCVAVFWLHPEILPLGLVSLKGVTDEIIKVAPNIKNRYGRVVPVISVAAKAFRGNKTVTDIILPSRIGTIPVGAFAGCANLKRIYLPKGIRQIKEKTFEGCSSLEDVYYEGSPNDWKAVHIAHEQHETEFGDLIPGTPVQTIESVRWIRVPGNEALFTANIHFLCIFDEEDALSESAVTSGEDVTGRILEEHRRERETKGTDNHENGNQQDG